MLLTLQASADYIFAVVIMGGMYTPSTQYGKELNTHHIKAGTSAKQVQKIISFASRADFCFLKRFTRQTCDPHLNHCFLEGLTIKYKSVITMW